MKEPPPPFFGAPSCLNSLRHSLLPVKKEAIEAEEEKAREAERREREAREAEEAARDAEGRTEADGEADGDLYPPGDQPKDEEDGYPGDDPDELEVSPDQDSRGFLGTQSSLVRWHCCSCRR